MNPTHTPYIISFLYQSQKKHGYAYYEKANSDKITLHELLKIAAVSFGIASLSFFFVF